MISTLKLTKDEAKRMMDFLDSMVVEYNDLYNSKSTLYEMIPVDQEFDVYEIEINDSFAGFMKTFDHDCCAGPEDGCSTCYYLMDLGIIQDIDPLDFLDETDNWNDELRDHESGGDK